MHFSARRKARRGPSVLCVARYGRATAALQWCSIIFGSVDVAICPSLRIGNTSRLPSPSVCAASRTSTARPRSGTRRRARLHPPGRHGPHPPGQVGLVPRRQRRPRSTKRPSLAVVCVPLPVWAARPLAAHSAATPSAHSARRFLPPPGWTEGRANVSARPLCAIWAVFRRSSVQRGRWLPSSQATRSSMSRCRRSNKSELASAAAEWLPTRCASAARRGAWDWSWGRLAWPWSAFRGAARVNGPGDRRAACRAGFPPCRPAGGDRGVQQGRRGATARQLPSFQRGGAAIDSFRPVDRDRGPCCLCSPSAGAGACRGCVGNALHGVGRSWSGRPARLHRCSGGGLELRETGSGPSGVVPDSSATGLEGPLDSR